MKAIANLDNEQVGAWEQYDSALHDIFDQMVRNDCSGTQQQKKWNAKIERMLRGGPDKVGELHRWMYDKRSLARILSNAGFTDIQQHSYNTSGIPEMNQYGLDIQENGKEYKEGSLYFEGKKPS